MRSLPAYIMAAAHVVLVGLFLSFLLICCAHEQEVKEPDYAARKFPPHSPLVKRNIPLKYGELKLDHNQVMVCAYDQEKNEIGCMSPEEFEIRRSAGEFQ